MMKIYGIEMFDGHNFVTLKKGEFMLRRLKTGMEADGGNRNPNFEGTE